MIEMVRVRQVFEDSHSLDIEAQLRKDFEDLRVENRLAPGSTVGIAVGSRGIDRIDEVVKL